MIPVVGLAGSAGSGKDTVAELLVRHHAAVALASADPIKRVCAEIFGFTPDQLWGPSVARNASDPERWSNTGEWEAARGRMEACSVEVCDLVRSDRLQAYRGLLDWFDYCEARGIDFTPRYALQTLGAEWGRRLESEAWIRHSLEACLKVLGGAHRYDRAVGTVRDDSCAGPPLVVITDVRFRNEIIEIKKIGGQVILVRRPEATGAEAEAAGVKGHSSERELISIPTGFFDYVLDNNGTVEDLEEAFEETDLSFLTGAPEVVSVREEVDWLRQQKALDPGALVRVG